MMISIIIPVLNESNCISDCLEPLQAFRHHGHEIILVDGGSNDATVQLSEHQIDKLVMSNPGRAIQMNSGALQASGDMLLFLHVDTLLPSNAETLLTNLKTESLWGRFNVRLSGAHWLLRVVEYCMNKRSRLTGVATGDQAIFVNKQLFEKVGGFPDIALMEDIAISKRLRKISFPVCLDESVVSSSRRWETYGIMSTIVKMWYLRLLYFCRVNPDRIAGMYGR